MHPPDGARVAQWSHLTHQCGTVACCNEQLHYYFFDSGTTQHKDTFHQPSISRPRPSATGFWDYEKMESHKQAVTDMCCQGGPGSHGWPPRIPSLIMSIPHFRLHHVVLISQLHERQLDFSYPVCGSIISLHCFIDCFSQKNQRNLAVHQASQYQWVTRLHRITSSDVENNDWKKHFQEYINNFKYLLCLLIPYEFCIFFEKSKFRLIDDVFFLLII